MPPKTKRRIEAEKGTILWASMALMSGGVVALVNKDYLHGSILIIVSLVLTYLREHLKFGRWAETSYWRGEKVKRD